MATPAMVIVELRGTGPGYGGYLDGQPGHPATGTGVKGAGGKIVVRFSRTFDFGSGQTLPGARSFNDDGKIDLILRDGALHAWPVHDSGCTIADSDGVACRGSQVNPWSGGMSA